MADTIQTRAQLLALCADNTNGAITAQVIRELILSLPFNTGAWSSATAYAVNDVVQAGGVNYIAIAANTNSAPPSANWSIF